MMPWILGKPRGPFLESQTLSRWLSLVRITLVLSLIAFCFSLIVVAREKNAGHAVFPIVLFILCALPYALVFWNLSNPAFRKTGLGMALGTALATLPYSSPFGLHSTPIGLLVMLPQLALLFVALRAWVSLRSEPWSVTYFVLGAIVAVPLAFVVFILSILALTGSTV